MSRIGKLPVPIPDKVKVTVQDRTVNVEGPLGRLDWTFPYGMTVTVDDGKREIRVGRPDDQRRHRALHGLTRALIANMVEGVTKGYERQLELYGTGYSVNAEGKRLVVQCGFAHPVEKAIPNGIQVTVDVPNTRGNDTPARFAVKGCDKQLVGEFAAEVRHIKPPEPYLGKGFRYVGEQIRRKAGKTFVGGAPA
ncbi:MAG: 50S ribosomal protein L6 [Planctomycetes bacterium SM23_25]|nr:MAG: 50S ribosomal protein L6 [Planctomycetes bacterium DG_20]KPK45249.1 MAG: 50S ribosomal protein L6 [Planctomycetes bacterium SM23_25]